jgi:hypothetical protein
MIRRASRIVVSEFTLIAGEGRRFSKLELPVIVASITIRILYKIILMIPLG